MTAVRRTDVRDMAIIHRFYRQAYSECARLVRAASPPSPERVGFLADHIDLCLAMLRGHHEGEDALLFPKLAERVPHEAAMTEEVGHQHKLVQDELDEVSRACAMWRDRPSQSTAEVLAAALDRLNSALQGHFDDEEHMVVPLAAVTLTQKEWDAVGAHGLGLIPRSKVVIGLGMVLDPLDETERAYMKSLVPPVLRMLLPLVVERPWKKYAAKLRQGT